MSQSAWSIAEIALIVTMPPLKYRPRVSVCQCRSTGRGSRPMTSGSRSRTAPRTERVCQPSDASPQPARPGSSVSTRTNTQSRSPASTTRVEKPVIRMLGTHDIVLTPPDGSHARLGTANQIDEGVGGGMRRVAFLGLGAMGAPMARRLVDAGHDLRIWNRSPGRDEGLIAAGARRAMTAAEAVRDAEVVITMLADPPALERVLFGPGGASETIAPGSILIDMSTVGPTAIRAAADRLPE